MEIHQNVCKLYLIIKFFNIDPLHSSLDHRKYLDPLAARFLTILPAYLVQNFETSFLKKTFLKNKGGKYSRENTTGWTVNDVVF